MAKKRPLARQVVVVAGGSYGLGRAIACAAAGRGAKVVVGARGREGLENAVREIEAAGSQGLAVETDVSRRDHVRALAGRNGRAIRPDRLVLLSNGWKGQHTGQLKPQDSPGQPLRDAPRRSGRSRTLR